MLLRCRCFQLCFESILVTSKNSLRKLIVSTFVRILHLVTLKVSDEVIFNTHTHVHINHLILYFGAFGLAFEQIFGFYWSEINFGF